MKKLCLLALMAGFAVAGQVFAQNTESSTPPGIERQGRTPGQGSHVGWDQGQHKGWGNTTNNALNNEEINNTTNGV
jgi:hypothetical protein